MTKIDKIKEKLTIEEVLDRYWSAPNWEGRYKCAMHNGKDYNMLVKNGFAYCFVCGESADCVKLTSKMFNITIGEAIKKIDDDFGLGLSRTLTASERRKFAEAQALRERERKRKEELERFETECLDKIAEKLRIADNYLLNKQFKGEPNSAEMRKYSESLDFVMYQKAKERVRWLEWLWALLTGDSHYLVEEDFCATYGTDNVSVLRKVYKGDIEI